VVPARIAAEMKARGKLLGDAFAYYRSSSGNITRYAKGGPL
jgi:hypothetical protein